MTEQIDTIQDLIRILETHPEWRVQLRPLILTDDLLTLPDQVRALTDRIAELTVAQERTEHHLSALATAQARSEQRLSKVEEILEQVVAAQARSEQRLSKVEEALVQLATAQARSEQRLGRVERDVATLKGDVLELRYGKRIVVAYGRWLRRSRILSHEQVYELLDDAVDAGHLTMDERDQIAQADVLVHGKDKETGEVVYLVVEVSWGVGAYDVERAAERAALLAKIGTSTRAAVVGRVIVPEAEEKARALGVWSWREEQQGGEYET